VKPWIIPLLIMVADLTAINAQGSYISDYSGNRGAGNEPELVSENLALLADLDQYDVTFYFLDLVVQNTTTYISGNAIIGAISEVPTLETLVFELSSVLTVDSILIDGVKHDFVKGDDIVTVSLTNPIPNSNYFDAQVYYRGTVPQAGFFSAMITREVSAWGTQVTWTLSEPYNALGWFPCKQVLSDKADSVYVFLTTDNSLMAGSNGILTDIVTLPGNKVRYEWKSYHPIAYYLISLSVADYQDYSIYAHPDGLSDSILIQNFIYNSPGYLAQNKSLIDKTVDLIELYSGLLVMYPFYDEKYGHCLAPMGGGMEHQTMTTLSGFPFVLVAHELGHMWFGDYVTCATWMDIWINEGFASYTEYLAYQNLISQEDADSWMMNAQSRALLEPEGSVYIPFDEIGNVGRIFSGNLSYKKGATLLHMIRFELDDDSLFFQTLKSYLTQYGDSVATGLDFRDVLETVSRKDFSDFFNQWYFGEGYPTFQIHWSQSSDSVFVRSTQTTSSDQTTLFKTPLEFLLLYDGGDTLVRVYQDQNIQDFVLTIPYQVQSLEFDPDRWLVKKVSSISHVSELQLSQSQLFSIWPNPAGELINLRFRNPGREHLVIISDLSGKIEAEFKTTTDQLSIPIPFLSQGIFLVTVEENGRRSVQKLVKHQ